MSARQIGKAEHREALARSDFHETVTWLCHGAPFRRFAKKLRARAARRANRLVARGAMA